MQSNVVFQPKIYFETLDHIFQLFQLMGKFKFFEISQKKIFTRLTTALINEQHCLSLVNILHFKIYHFFVEKFTTTIFVFFEQFRDIL